MFTMRFDMRSPAQGAPTPDLYAAALDMAGWAEQRGAVAAIVCEHHGLSDGYLPAPMIFATALAARTTTLPVVVAVVATRMYAAGVLLYGTRPGIRAFVAAARKA